MPASVDPDVQGSILAQQSMEAAGAGTSRTRSWDILATGAGAMWQMSLASPTVMAGQGIRMLNGTPTDAPPGPQNYPQPAPIPKA